MDNFYSCHVQPTSPHLATFTRRRLRFCGHIFLLLTVFLLKTGLVNGQDHLDSHNEVVGYGFDKYGAYVDFTFTYYNDNNYNSWLNDGDIYCIPEYGDEFKIAQIESVDKIHNKGDDIDNYRIKIRPDKGTIVAKGWENDFPEDFAKNPSGWHVITANSTKTVSTYVDDNNARVYIRWYVPNDYTGQNLKFRYHWEAIIDWDNGNNGGDGGPSEYKNEDYPNFGIQSIKLTPLSTPTLSAWDFSSTPNKFVVKYNYTTANHYDATISFDGQTQMVKEGETPSGSFNIGRSNSTQIPSLTANAVLKYVGQINGYVTSYGLSKEIVIPAYIWPDSLNAAYDGANTVTLSWQVPLPAGEDFITGDNFEIQRSTDPGFEENVKTVGAIAYDANVDQYSMDDELTDISDTNRVYYRLRRTKSSPKWGWGESRKTHALVTIMNHLYADTARLDEVDGIKGIITWEPFQGVWMNGTKLTLKKENLTTGETIDINLTEEEARAGKYIDENIQICKQFVYSVKLNHGNNYTSPKEVDIPGNVLAIDIGTISTLDASKGYFSDRVELSWQTEGGFDSYLVGRRPYGSANEFIELTSVSATQASKSVRISDKLGAPGTYYEYSIVGAVSCGNTIQYSNDTLYAIGFRSPTGSIYGRITYENGQAVQDVTVRIENDDQEQLGQSIYLNGSSESYLHLDSLITPFNDSAFTVEAWIRPNDASPVNQVIFSKEGQYEMGFDQSGQLYFDYNGQQVVGNYNNTTGAFVHITGIHSLDTLRLLLNDSLIAEAIQPFVASSTLEKQVFIGRNKTGNNFSGFLDEVRVWNIALSVDKVSRQYTRLLSGGEQGLTAYWRFDETIVDQFYDLSHFDDRYNRNDGKMGPLQVKRSNTIPTPAQLSLKAHTDSTGNYNVTGIPYFGNGSTYTVVPLLGTHQFDPVLEKRLISATDPSFTVNFVDKSSFPVSGYVYYFDGTVPVEGVQFQIDGKYAQTDNGELIQTDVNGKFTISVPVGPHEVKAVKNNHIFVNEGKITNRFGENLNYQGPISERILRDSTTIRFIGRVAGGIEQESFPLGHSLSKNNLGKQLSITMSLPTGSKYDLHSGSLDTTVWIHHLMHSDTSTARKTRIVFHRNKVVIYPDSLTGEFAVNLIPEKFTVDNVQATGWGNLLNGEGVTVDFTNKFMDQYSIQNHADSNITANGWEYVEYTDSVIYNDSYRFIKRVSPSMNIVQLAPSGDGQKWFGDEVYNTNDANGEELELPIIDENKTGRAMYLLGYPVFRQGSEYLLRINAFEEYPFYEGVLPNGTAVIAIEEGEEVKDRVPTSDGEVSIFNTIRNGATSADTLSLDSVGTGYYSFRADEPAVTAPGLKSLSVSIRFGQATDLNWSWMGQPKLEGFVMGTKMTGTDFVTAGPDKLLAVLRDPPGSRSYSFIEEGSTYRSSSAYKTSVDQVGSIEAYVLLGTKVITFFGLGGGVIKEVAKSNNETGIGVVHEEHYNYSNTKETSTTITSRFQTSDAAVFVGVPGDVYIGHSTNITYGQTRNAIIIRREDKKASDSLLHDPGASTDYLVVMREGINFGEQFGTLFAYPQQHLVKVLIPNLKHIRNSFLLPPGTNGQAIANSSGKPAYVSKLEAEDPDFGESNDDAETFGERSEETPFNDGESYTIYFPEDMDYRTDTIMVLNQYISGWEQRIKHNEKQKIETGNAENRSFHAGSPFSYSEQFSETKTVTNSFNIIVAAKVLHESSFKISGQGFKLKVDESLGTSQGGEFETSEDGTSTIGYTLASEGTDNYISVDVAKPEGGGFVFRTLGGATACPYEGEELTQYYNPGTVINVATQRIEVPVMTVDEAVVNDVPASQKASYTLRIKNESEARLPTTLMLSYLDTDSIKGATISVDGLPIGGTGRPIPVQYGQTVTKVITLTKGPEAMDYENIPIILKSACQYDPTGYQETIADTVLISAHFVPACGNVNIKSPTNQWVLNTDAPLNGDDKRYLHLVIDQFDLSNSLFHRIELQYKPAASGTWITAMKFYGDSSTYQEAQGEKLFITNALEILYNLEMDDASFNDQGYDIRAVSICKLGPNDFITTPSPVISGLKDTYNPRLFGSTQPANGVLGISDEIRLNFNETIAAGLLTYPDFQVRGIRNGSIGNHSVSVVLDGAEDYLETEFDKNLTDKNITVEMWVLPDALTDGTVFSHGDINQSMEMAFTVDNKLQVTVGGKTVESENSLNYKAGEWAHVALVYNSASSTVSAFYNFVEVIHNVAVEAYTGTGHVEFGRSIAKSGDFYAGKMHGVRIWTEALTGIQLQVNSLKRLSGGENGLLGYYPMTEGKGEMAFDKAHGSHARLQGEWSTPAGKAVSFAGSGYVKMSTGMIPITDEMDYTMELWFNGDAGQGDATLASNGRGGGGEFGGSHDLFFLGFEGGLLTFRNNNFKIQAEGNYLDNRWHHVALAVNRASGTSQIFVDGELKNYFDTQNLGGIAAPFIYLGARGWQEAGDAVNVHFDQYFKGQIDEFRLWNTYLNQVLISANNNVHLAGTELGLQAYYPFETYVEFQNNQELDFTLKDMRVQADPSVMVPAAIRLNATQSDDKAPIKDRGPVENLQFDFVVNNDALIITLLEPRQAVDKTIVTFQVKDVRDLNGNTLRSPITWTAYIDRNQLKWSDVKLNLSKDVYEPMQFESYAVNSGGNIQNFTLDGLPAWLRASPASGTVDPQGRQKITFTVDEGLNVGSYDKIVYMRNDNDESEALSINLKVKGDEPDWVVDLERFAYNMTLYGKLRINNIFSDDEGDMLAVFKGGECVGVAHNSYNADNDFWYVFLTVYSDSVTTGQLEFRMWDASTGKTYFASPSKLITFKNNAIIGSADAPVVFTGEEMLFQNIQLAQGWNWISLNLASPTLPDVGTTLAKGKWASGDMVKNEDMGFDQYSTSTHSWLGSMAGGFNNISLFMLNTANAQVLSLKGTLVDIAGTPITVKGNRWSYISYLPQVNMTVGEALAGYAAADEDVIKSQTGFAMYDADLGWVGNLSHMEPGRGYMLYRNAATDVTFVYPSFNGSLNSVTGFETNRSESAIPGNLSFAENMTALAAVGGGFKLRPGDELLAYVNDELRGRAAQVDNPMTGKPSFFLNIPGRDARLVAFKLERMGQIVASARPTIAYRSNSMLGSLAAPFMVDFRDISDHIVLYPNPFVEQINIDLKQMLSGKGHELQLRVYDLSGNLIFEGPKERVSTGSYHTTWDGRNARGGECTAGLYFISISIDGVPHVYKAIKR